MGSQAHRQIRGSRKLGIGGGLRSLVTVVRKGEPRTGQQEDRADTRLRRLGSRLGRMQGPGHRMGSRVGLNPVMWVNRMRQVSRPRGSEIRDPQAETAKSRLPTSL